jgi:hypothetical protein
MLWMKNRTVAEVLTECWRIAEERTIERCKRATEEEITFFFRLQLVEVVEEASRKRRFERAFLHDLKLSFPRFNTATLESISRGLIASVNFHHRHHEGKISGADVGIVLSRPKVRRVGDEIVVELDSMRALLAQAKLGMPEKGRYKWGKFSKPQHRIVPHHREYYSLLLYRYNDVKRSKLLPFGWQLCAGYTIADAEQWLKTDEFPHEVDSVTVIRRLAMESIGTTDGEVIKDIIDPQNERTDYLEIRITWSPESRPPSRVRNWMATQAQRLSVRNRILTQ